MSFPTVPVASHIRPTVWLTIARVFQILIICVAIGLFIMSIPINYEHRSRVCTNELCPPDQINYAGEEALERTGLSVESYATLTLVLEMLVAVTFTACAVIIFLRKPNNLFAIFVTVMLVTYGLATSSDALRTISISDPQLSWLIATIAIIGVWSIHAFLYVFPNGRFTPRWTVAFFMLWVLYQTPRYYFPNSAFNIQSSIPSLYNALFISGNLGAVFTQIYRYKHVSNSVEKEQIKWVVYGLSLCVIGYLISGSVILKLGDPNGSDLPIKLLFVMVSTLSVLLIPVSISVAILRYRLWDINPLINRTVVYASLTALVVGIYVLIVSYLSFLFRTQSNFFISLIATGMVAVLFQPLREWLQQGVNHLMYGERDEPAAVLSRLGQRLEASLEPDSVLPSVVETVGQALKLPYVAIALKDGADFALAAEYGRFVTADESKADLIKMPLTYQSETVGELIVAPRASNERFSPADKKLLSILSQQAGVAAHTIRLTHELRNLNLDLQKSREELVTAREEERRRIRRDLHDGVGPILASLLQRLDAVRLLIPRDPEKAASIAEALKGQVKSTIADIRRLVYALRPPVLDELGLVSAIREYTADYQGAGSLQVTLNAPETLPRLPAAVEVAAYRIVLEAFANVVHHSQATKCDITIRLEAQQTGSLFCVDIQDNGQGLPEKHHAGVGIVSMRERTSELGGSIYIEASKSIGTRIRACLPFSEEEK